MPRSGDPLPSLRRKLFSGTAYTLASVLLLQALSLSTSVIYARLLGRESLGALAVFMQMAGTIVPLSTLGIGTVVVKLIPEHRKRDPSELESILASSLAILLIAGITVAVAYFALADPLTTFYGVSDLRYLFLVSAGLVVFDALVAFAAAILQGFQRTKQLAVLNLVARAVVVPVLFFLTWTWGLLGVALTAIVAESINVAVYSRAARATMAAHGVRIRWSSVKLASGSKILRLSLPLFASFLVLKPAFLFQSSYIAFQLGYPELGLYQVAYSLYRIVLLFPAALSVPLLPAISEIYAEEQRDRTRARLSGLIRITALVSLPLTIALGLGSGPIIGLLYGTEYLAASTLVFVLSLAAFIDTIGSVVETTFLGTGRTLSVLALAGMQAAIIGIGTLLLVGAFGLVGAAFAMLANAVVYALLAGGYFVKREELNFREFRSSLILALGSLAVATALVILGAVGSLIIVAVFLAALLPLEYLLLSKRDRFVLKDALSSILQGGTG